MPDTILRKNEMETKQKKSMDCISIISITAEPVRYQCPSLSTLLCIAASALITPTGKLTAARWSETFDTIKCTSLKGKGGTNISDKR